MPDLRLLTPDRVGDLVGSCAPCTFWQTVPRNGHGGRPAPEARLEELAHWVEQVTADWGPPGRIAYVDDRPFGHVVLAPARFVPRLAAFPTAPSDPAAVMLVTAVTAPDANGDGRGLRKVLLQAAAKDALKQHVRSLDVVASRPVAVGPHDCVLEAAPLEKFGFRVERDHPAYPRLRIDLRTAVTLRDEAAAYVARALARIPGVHPAPEVHPRGSSSPRSADQP
ncbi:MAG TPA: N-acetyltransferase [Humibacillus sp.]|nr:N-acetyltransferase [Humibacillus sp.]